MQKLLIIFVMATLSVSVIAKDNFEQGKVLLNMGDILSAEDRIAPINAIVKSRLENLLPTLMREAKLDMWIVINREYVEDALFFTLVPQPTFAARRTTILVFYYQMLQEFFYLYMKEINFVDSL